MRLTIVLFAALLNVLTVTAQEVSHPKLGTSVKSPGGLTLTLVDRRQNWNQSETGTYTPSINSPKSVNIAPDGSKFYVNSLEGATTVVFDAATGTELKTIRHIFNEKDHASLWAPESGYYKFTHYDTDLRTFRGKPVESAFSHGGRYLWVPYYRRSFDLNAQDPSAIAVIDARKDSIIRLFETGTLPKMIAVSPDSRRVAVAHWGDNTVGYLDISSPDPEKWKHLPPFTVDRKLTWDLSLEKPVDRDTGSGNALRGTVFTPDGRYLLVGCMSGGGIAVIDVAAKKYLGKITGMMPNLRHLVIAGDKLYLSINASGYVQRIPLAKVMEAIGRLNGSGNVNLPGWESCKVAGGARTLEVSPDGSYIFVACNSGSRLCVVDSTMHLVGEMGADSFPVGLDLSPDGRWLITTSQGRKGSGGGNCVDIFALTGLENDFVYEDPDAAPADSVATPAEKKSSSEASVAPAITYIIIGGAAAVAIVILLIIRRKNKHKQH